MIGLDTTACIDYLNGHNKIKEIIEREDDMVCITSITTYEVQIGLNRTRRKISEQRYSLLNKKWAEFLIGMEILPLREKEALKSAEIYVDLETIGQIIDDNDILIAGILLSNDITEIITRNGDHFNRITRLSVIVYE